VLRNDAANDEIAVLQRSEGLAAEVRRLRTELRKCEARLVELDRLAHWDPLLDLPNRRSFLSSLDQLVARVKRYGGTAALIFVDVDGLKAINDSFGHDAGDKALIEVARLLKSSVREADLVSRISGDEFGILLEHADELSAWQTALRITETCDDYHSFCIAGICLPLTVAAGVAVIRSDDSPEKVLKRADQEMYRIKGIGRVAINFGRVP